LTLTWESMNDSVNTDPLILAAIRVLAIWIREDENDNLRNESAGLMDMLVELYKTSSPEKLDFRYPILLALEGMMTTEDGVDNFLGQEGWQVIGQDLEALLRSTLNEQSLYVTFRILILLSFDGLPLTLPYRASNPTTLTDAARGLEIVRVLLAVVDSPSTDLNEDWMAAVRVTTSMKPPSETFPSIILELQIAMVQLSAALLSKAAGGMQKRHVTSIAPLSGLVQQLMKIVSGMSNKLDGEEYVISLPIQLLWRFSQ